TGRLDAASYDVPGNDVSSRGQKIRFQVLDSFSGSYKRGTSIEAKLDILQIPDHPGTRHLKNYFAPTIRSNLSATFLMTSDLIPVIRYVVYEDPKILRKLLVLSKTKS